MNLRNEINTHTYKIHKTLTVNQLTPRHGIGNSRSTLNKGIQATDLIISVTENTKADWSFGMGRAQFLEGDL